MESAKRASVVIIVWHLNFSFFFKKRGSKGKEVKKQSKKSSRHRGKCSHHQKQQKVQFRKKSRIFRMNFFFHSHRVNALLRFQTHTHTHA